MRVIRLRSLLDIMGDLLLLVSGFVSFGSSLPPPCDLLSVSCIRFCGEDV